MLLAGNGHIGPYELLASPRLEKLLRDARSFYDYVLIDTPPVVPLVDCRLLGRWVDGFIVVVAAHKTPRKVVAEALNLLDPAKIIGIVFNGDDRPLAAYYGYYGGYQQSPGAVLAQPLLVVATGAQSVIGNQVIGSISNALHRPDGLTGSLSDPPIPIDPSYPVLDYPDPTDYEMEFRRKMPRATAPITWKGL